MARHSARKISEHTAVFQRCSEKVNSDKGRDLGIRSSNKESRISGTVHDGTILKDIAKGSVSANRPLKRKRTTGQVWQFARDDNQETHDCPPAPSIERTSV